MENRTVSIKEKAILLVLLVFIIGCKQRNIESSTTSPNQLVASLNNQDTSSVDLPIKFMDVAVKCDKIDSIKVDDFIDTILTVKLETGDNFLIGRIDKVYILTDRIVVFDQNLAQAIFVFDLSGKFINKYNKRGLGPGEYVALNDLAASSDSIFALINNSAILCFDKNLNLTQTVKLDCWASCLAKDVNSSGFIINGITPEGDYAYCNSTGKSLKHFLKNHNSGNIFGMHNYSVVNKSNLFYHPLLDTVYSIGQNKCTPVRFFCRDKSKGYFSYFETNHTIFFRNNMRWLYKNKISNQEYWVNFHTTSSKSLIFSHYYIDGIYKEFFISSLDPAYIFSETAMKFSDNFINEIRKEVTIDSNPIILFTKFK